MRAHVAENQFNDYLEHATNTEHASLIIHPPPTNVHLRWTEGSHREACKTWRAHVTGNQFNAYLEHATNTEHANLIILLPQQTSTFGGQGLATEKHVKHLHARFQETNSTLT